MSRNRIIYQSQAVYAGPDKTLNATTSAYEFNHEDGSRVNSESTTDLSTYPQPNQLQRIQSANYSFDIARQDVNQYGDLAAIDRIILESPTVSLDLSWYLCSFYNESKVGFNVTSSGSTLESCLSRVLEGSADERNYYVRIVSNGLDAAGFGDNETSSVDASKVFGIGNGFMSSYSSEASVGALPTCSLNVEALNLAVMDGKTGFSPYVTASDGSKNTTHKFKLPKAETTVSESTVTALKPGDITLDLPNLMGAETSKVQSYNLSFDLAREPLSKLGSKFAFAREITFPVTVSLSVDVLVGDLITGNLATLVSSDSTSSHDVVIKLKVPNAANTALVDHIAYKLAGAKLDGQSFSSSLGDNETATLNFSSQIGSLNQTSVGLFMSGVHA